MATVSDDLGRVAWKRGIKGQTLVFTNAFIGRDTLSCLGIAVFQNVIKVAMSHSTWKMYRFINSDNFDATDLRFSSEG